MSVLEWITSLLLSLSIIEWVAAFLSLGYLILLSKQRVEAWALGILSSAIYVYLCYSFKLYAETGLYFFYVLIGFYGWYNWKRNSNDSLKVNQRTVFFHLTWIIGLFILGIGLGRTLDKFTDAVFPYIDSLTTVFGIFASWLEAKKILEGWYYWIILNAAAIGIYYLRGLEVTAGLMIIYTIMSFVGLSEWKKSLK